MGSLTFQKESAEAPICVLLDGVKKGEIIEKQLGFQYRPSNTSIFKCGPFHKTLNQCRAQVFKEVK